LHGEAISIGQVAAAKLSTRLLDFPKADAARIEKLFWRAGLPTRIKLSAAQKKRLLGAMMLDKKVSEGEVKFVLARSLGQVEPGQKAAAEQIFEAMEV
jgi:3-dehydroquinate synthetase